MSTLKNKRIRFYLIIIFFLAVPALIQAINHSVNEDLLRPLEK